MQLEFEVYHQISSKHSKAAGEQLIGVAYVLELTRNFSNDQRLLPRRRQEHDIEQPATDKYHDCLNEQLIVWPVEANNQRRQRAHARRNSVRGESICFSNFWW